MSVSSLNLRLEGVDDGRTIEVDLSRRMLRVTGAGEALEGTELGLLQVAPRWASVTGRLRAAADGEESAFVLVVDESSGTVTLEIDGRPARVYRVTSYSLA